MRAVRTWTGGAATPVGARAAGALRSVARGPELDLPIDAAKPLRPSRLATRRRLVAALALLGAAFLAALAIQLHQLAGMRRATGELHLHEEHMRLALELEGAIREQFAHEAHLVIGEGEHLAAYQEAQRRAARLADALSGAAREPALAAWIADIVDASRELDRVFRESVAPAVGVRAGDAARAHAQAYPLVYRAEEATDRIFAYLRDRTAAQSAALEAAQRTTERLALLFLVAVPLLAVGLAVHLSRSIARPLAEIGEGAARIARGELGTRIGIAGGDEFGTLASELNAMAATLERDRDALVRSEKLAGLGRVAAGIAHELNDPIQVMLGYLGLHRDVGGQVGLHLGRVEREAARCRDIVEALLQLARPAQFVAVPVDLHALAVEVADGVRVSNPRGPPIHVEGDAMALGTEGRLRQVAFNLVRNAAEAAGPHGAVHVRVGREGPHALLSVSDTGPGVPADVRRRIFEPFVTTKPTGTGLGLAIASAIAGSLGGELSLQQEEGRGARFTLRVPGAERGGR